MFKKMWGAFREKYPSRFKAFLALSVFFLGCLIAAGVLMTAGAAGLAITNTEAFCTGCHEMRDNVFAEYKGTIHDTNRTGVRAICSDCHVPRAPMELIQRKMRASFEVWNHILGELDTKEKFNAERPRLAQKVWRRMKQTDSLECRNCHNSEKMNMDLQSDKAKARHAKAKADGKTCIECHFGIAHKEPEGPGPADLKLD